MTASYSWRSALKERGRHLPRGLIHLEDRALEVLGVLGVLGRRGRSARTLLLRRGTVFLGEGVLDIARLARAEGQDPITFVESQDT